MGEGPRGPPWIIKSVDGKVFERTDLVSLTLVDLY